MNKLTAFMEALAVDARLQHDYGQNPLATLKSYGLNEQEQDALIRRDGLLIQQLSGSEDEFDIYIHVQGPFRRRGINDSVES